MEQEQRVENPFEQGNEEPIGFIKIIPSEPIAFADKLIKDSKKNLQEAI